MTVPTPRLLASSGVVLTALLCLGLAGYAGQVWWARRLVLQDARYSGPGRPDSHGRHISSGPQVHYFIDSWRGTPWYGILVVSGTGFPRAIRWFPRRIWFERLKLFTGQSLPEDPDAWEAWFKAHPNLVWDEKRKRLVEGPTP